jgi:hypothetical protein
VTKDYSIAITPDPAGVCFTMIGPNLPANGMQVRKALATLAEEDGNLLRRGTATLAVVDAVQGSTSEWLLGNGIDVALSMALGSNGDAIRLIWNVDPLLRRTLAETPFEIVRPNGGGTVYVLNPRIQSFTHRLEKVGMPPTSPIARSYPLRCLIVRANPGDLGGAVPPALPIVQQIQQHGAHLVPQHLRVHVLSREQGPDVVGLPTLEVLDERLREGYDLLVYIGHGDLLASHQGLDPVGVLQLESDDGESHESVASNKLAVLLHTAPVPVVLLLGCLTANEVIEQMRELVLDRVPQWMRGGQSVAQALVNSESGVQVAVGMRYRTEAGDARLFVDRFFRSLLRLTPGHVEAAVQYARQQLYLTGAVPTSWIAPVVFSALAPEPLFGFLGTAPGCPVLEQHSQYRGAFWSVMAKIPAHEIGGELATSIREQLDSLDTQVVTTISASGHLLMPARVEAVPESTVSIPIHLHGPPLDVEQVDGRVIAEGGDARINRLELSAAAQAAGFVLLDRGDSPLARTFLVRRENGAAALAPGHLLTAEVRVSPAGRTALLVSLDQLASRPVRPLCTAANAVLVLS